ncbi:MAG: NAD(+)/NADH kinase [Planctomycetales bacterium]|nr:NAD(+)/NADH kinase [Planctomycetales bacterium]
MSWKHQPPRVVLLGDRERAEDHLDRIRELVKRHADIVLEDFDFQRSLSDVSADFGIVLGGDGSMLRAAKQVAECELPVLGVNLGRLGFLAALTPDELSLRLPKVCEGECRVVEHLMFHAEIWRDGQLEDRCLGLNEMAVLGGAPFSLLEVNLYVDAEWATTYSCDGLIISTPVGSTAHSLSAGGPILEKSLQAFVIQPISPHTLTVRPVVDSASRTYEVQVPRPNPGTAIVVDGRMWASDLSGNERIRIVRAPSSFRMIEVQNRNHYRTLREKLGWGGYLPSRRDPSDDANPAKQ